MRIEENKQLVLDFYAAGARGDMDAAFAMLADDITWTNIGSTRFSGTFRGKQALGEELLGPLFGQLKAGIASTVERLTAEGDIVVAQTSGVAETRDGTPYNNSYCQVIEIRGGKIAAVKEYLDTELVSDVFGVTENNHTADAGYRSFAEFYPFYLSQHANRTCRRLHFIGSLLVLAILAYSLLSGKLLWLLALPVVGYGFAWLGHFGFEKNKPATFIYPIYSLRGDWVMFFQMLTGKISF